MPYRLNDDKEGTVVLYVSALFGETIVDEFQYSEDFHNQLIK